MGKGVRHNAKLPPAVDFRTALFAAAFRMKTNGGLR